jgi:succinate-semialdehyde dehydrogenase / glutarate-semialdehyde dehydrogenase
MAYQTINPYTEELIKTFRENTDAQLEAIIGKAEAAYENDWNLQSLAERKAVVKKAASILRESSTNLQSPLPLGWASCSKRAEC